MTDTLRDQLHNEHAWVDRLGWVVPIEKALPIFADWLRMEADELRRQAGEYTVIGHFSADFPHNELQARASGLDTAADKADGEITP